MPANAVYPSLADPEICGEDLARNLKRAIAIAPRHCVHCNDYHVISAAKRLSGQAIWERGSRASLIKTLRPNFDEISASNADRIDVVVAACADTAVLSTAVHAALRENETLLSRTYFTALDRCRTPLTLCEDYAAQYGLQVHTEIIDLLETTKDFPADIIVMHNFLPFVPVDRHEIILNTLGSWLKDNGRIVIWNAVHPLSDHDHTRLRRNNHIAHIKAMIDNGRVEINEPKDVFFSRLEDNIEDLRIGGQRFVDINSLPNLIASAGLAVRSVEEISHINSFRAKLYTIVVAGRPAS